MILHVPYMSSITTRQLIVDGAKIFRTYFEDIGANGGGPKDQRYMAGSPITYTALYWSLNRHRMH